MWSKTQQQRKRFRERNRSPQGRRDRMAGVGKASSDVCATPIAYQGVSFKNTRASPETVFTQPAPCQHFFDTKTMDERCQQCLNVVQNLDSECPCSLDAGNVCEYAKCLTESQSKCPQTYQNFFNVKRKPFGYDELRECSTVNAVEGYSSSSKPQNDTYDRPVRKQSVNGNQWLVIIAMSAATLYCLFKFTVPLALRYGLLVLLMVALGKIVSHADDRASQGIADGLVLLVVTLVLALCAGLFLPWIYKQMYLRSDQGAFYAQSGTRPREGSKPPSILTAQTRGRSASTRRFSSSTRERF